MSELANLEDAKQTLRNLAITATETVTALHDGLTRPEADSEAHHRTVLNRSLKSAAQTREGFLLSLRTSEVAMAAELRILVGYLIDWSWLDDLGLRWATDEPLERLSGQIVLYQHALVALGVLPRLPSNAVTHPYRTYSDVPVPESPGAMLDRLEEIERTVWSASSEPVKSLPREAVRRTYGFFEATTWLLANHMADLIGL